MQFVRCVILQSTAKQITLVIGDVESPLVFEARLYLGKTLIAMRKPEEGIAILNDLWADVAVPHETRIQSQRTQADYYFEKENYRQARVEYEKILEDLDDKRDRGEVRYQIGDCHYELGDYEAAQESFRNVSSEKPSTKVAIAYRFESPYVYYPLVVSRIGGVGKTRITLAVFTPGLLHHFKGLRHEQINVLGDKSVDLTAADLKPIDPGLAEIMGSEQFKGRIFEISGDINAFNGDVMAW